MAISHIIAASPANITLFRDTDVNETDDEVKSGSTTIHCVVVDNTANAAVTFIKFYNATSGSVTVGTTDPDFVLRVPGSTKRTIFFHEGIIFNTALTVAAVTTGGTGGTTGPTSDVALEILYV